jgi:addiction module HigA family antidote
MTTTIEESAVQTHRIPENRPPTHPGEMLLKEFLDPLDMSQRELADRLGVHYPRVNELVNGKRGITTETALMLAKLFGTTPDLWLNLQNTWDLYETLHDPSSSEKVEGVEPLERTV